jgi:hypothetical protein
MPPYEGESTPLLQFSDALVEFKGKKLTEISPTRISLKPKSKNLK